MKRSPLLSLVLLFVSVVSMAAQPGRRPDPRPLSTVDIITLVNDHWQQTHSPQVRAFWDEAAYHTGNMEAFRLLGCARWLSYSEEWARHNMWMGARSTDPAGWKYTQYGEGDDYVLFADWQICFQTYLDLNSLTPAPFKVARAIEVMDYEVRQPQTDFWWWADALYMAMPVLTRLYLLTGEVKYLDKLYDNFCWTDSLLFDADEHLYYRDAKYIYPKVTTQSGGKDFWARGDGWVLAGLARVLADMPQDYRHRPFFEQRFRQLAEAVGRCQQPEGYWTRSLLDARHAPGPETSGTAFFCYGLLWGVNHGLLQRDAYGPVIDRAWAYLTGTALQQSGAVGYVQPIGERAIPGQQLGPEAEANFGVGAFLLAACEHLRYEDAPSTVDGGFPAITGASTVAGGSPAITVSVVNPDTEYRQQLIELDAGEVYARLGLHGGRQFIVLDPAGLEIPYQLSYDDRLLIDAGVAPLDTLRLTIRRGTPRDYPFTCYGRLYPERKDDYAWENDRGAYRVYGPALQRTGERSFGTDVWSKNTPELVVEQRYWTEDVVTLPALHQRTDLSGPQRDSIYRLHSYHYDHGRGMDLYQVGPTLGCGTPALMLDGQLAYPYCFTSYEVLDNGPLRTTVLLNYGKTAFGGDSITEHRLITLDKGSNFNRCTVWYSGLSNPAQLATGVVLHSDDAEGLRLADDYVAYADPTDNPRAHSCRLFVATLYPDADVTTSILEDAGGYVRHALGVLPDYRGQRYTYYFGSAWSRFDVRTMSEWICRIQWTLRQLRQPLQVTIS